MAYSPSLLHLVGHPSGPKVSIFYCYKLYSDCKCILILTLVTSYKAHGSGLLSDAENLLGDVDDDPEVVRDRRDSTAGFVSYGFGVFGGYRSAYGWRRGDMDRRDKGQTGDGSGGAGGHKSSTTDGLAGWWKMEDNPLGQYKG